MKKILININFIITIIFFSFYFFKWKINSLVTLLFINSQINKVLGTSMLLFLINLI